VLFERERAMSTITDVRPTRIVALIAQRIRVTTS
jgi:hypothetical protein